MRTVYSPRFSSYLTSLILCAITSPFVTAQVVDLGNHARLISLSPPDAPGYAGGEVNATSICRSSILTHGDQQFAAYFDGRSYHVIVARRRLNDSTWQLFDTGVTPYDVANAHDAISMGIDGDGFLHLSWGMHAQPLKYARTKAPVTGDNNIPAFSAEEVLSALPGQTSNLHSFARVTYPEFYNVPNSKDLLVFYRLGSSGSGSEYLSRYDAATRKWTSLTPGGRSFISGREVPGVNWGIDVNPYLNNLAYDSRGNLHVSWTWRSGRDSKAGVTNGLTNYNQCYAVSPAGAEFGHKWTRSNGVPYVGEITQAVAADDPSGAEIACTIVEGSMLVNQASMAIDRNDCPVIASWWAPKHTTDPNTSVDTVQYMIVYHDGQRWHTSQITNRQPAASNAEEPSAHVHAQPIVIVDDENRVIVVMRYDRKHRGDAGLQVAYSTDRKNWKFLDLTTEPLGDFEPTYDWKLWDSERKLAMLYQPVGPVWDGRETHARETSPVHVLEWDVGRYFADEAGE